MKIFQNLEDLRNHLLEVFEQYKIQIISIDGIDGSGKSTLASNLAENMNMFHINLDDKYLIKNKGTYINFIKYKNLKSDLLKYLKENNKVIVDGICVLNILDNIKINPDLKIYVKRLDDVEYWFDGKEFDYSHTVEEVLQKVEESIRSFIEIEAKMEGKNPEPYEFKESLTHEIIKYHFEYQPDINADIIYERIGNPPLDKCSINL